MGVKQNLPEYKKPPLIEVALSVQFDSLSNLTIPKLGLLWGKYRNRFPEVEQHPPAESVIELLGVRNTIPKKPTIKFSTTPPLPRLWFVDKNGNELLQVQNDMFGRNWRKVRDQETYPRYEKSIRSLFENDLNEFLDFLTQEGLGVINPNQCMITYVNHIHSCEAWEDHSEISKVFNYWDERTLRNSSLGIEEIKFAISHILNDAAGEFVGRLHTSVEPAFWSKNDRPIFIFNLTARGRPMGDGLEGIMNFMDFGRSHIVKTFDEMTTLSMHKYWEKL